jgi:hypothetical protein
MKNAIGWVGLVVVFLAGCAAPPGHIKVSQTSKLYPGMTRADVISALGEPEHAVAVDGREMMTYVANGRTFRDRPFEVTLIDGVLRTYRVFEPDPAKAESPVGSSKEQVAVPWFSPEAYARLLVILPTSERERALPYDQWLAGTTREEHDIRSTGRVPVRVIVEPIEVESWCRYHDVPLGKEAIAAFAGMKVGLERNGTRAPNLALQ